MSECIEVRKTKAVVIKALCDILRPVISDLVVLDLFAGLGSVSRALVDEGARCAYAVDLRSPPQQDEGANIHWFQSDVIDFITESGPPEIVDLIFMDPPYRTDYVKRLLPLIAEAKWLNDRAIVAVETSALTNYKIELDRSYGKEGNKKLYLMRDREYGGSRLTIYQSDREKAAVEPESDG